MQRSPAQSLAAWDQVSQPEMKDLKRKAPTKAILPLDFINASVLTEGTKYRWLNSREIPTRRHFLCTLFTWIYFIMFMKILCESRKLMFPCLLCENQEHARSCLFLMV